MRTFRSILAIAAAFLAVNALGSNYYNENEAGDVSIVTYSVTNTSYTWTNVSNRTMVRPTHIEYPASGITNSFSVKQVRVTSYPQYGTNMLYAPTNTVYTRTTNYWLFSDVERNRYGQSIVTTNDSSVVLTVVGDQYIGYMDEITISHTPATTSSVTPTTIVFKEQ